MLKVKVDGDQRREILRQIGRMNVACISGGRVKPIEAGVELPVAYGYSVRIELGADDYYQVSRIFRRGSKEWVKGSRGSVDCFEVGQAAYYASCYVSYDEGEWELQR